MLSQIDIAEIRRPARTELAAALRIAVTNDFHEGIDNHFTLVVPGTNDRFYLNPFGRHWSEIAAGDLLEVTYEGEVVGRQGIADVSATCIHGPIHRLIPAARCVLHTHMPYTTAICQLEDMTLEMTGQTALMFHDKIAYDYHYSGYALNASEGERMAAAMGDKPILMLQNHGVIVTGRDVAQAFHRLYFLERAARTQLYSMWTGTARKTIPPAVIDRVREQASVSPHNLIKSEADYHFEALMRQLDRTQPEYRL